MSDDRDIHPPSGNGELAAHGATTGLAWALRSAPGDVRPHNEDFAGAFVSPPPSDAGGPVRGPLFVVCDGLGGHAAGDVASRTAVDAALASWSTARSTTAHQAARAATRAANLAVYDASLSSGRRGMATTFTALTVAGAEAVVSHVGDSRAYLVREGVCSQLTADHSRVGEMLRMGLIDAEQAAVHPGRSQLTRTIGSEISVQVDIVRTPTEADDVFVLCSDGLWDVVARLEIAELAGRLLSGSAWAGVDDVRRGSTSVVDAVVTFADRLVERALARRSPDNVSVLAVRVTGDAALPDREGRRARLRWGRR